MTSEIYIYMQNQVANTQSVSQHKPTWLLHVDFLIWNSQPYAYRALHHLLLSYLEEVSWQLFMSVTIIKGQSCGETGHRDAMLYSSADCSAPWLLNTKIKQANKCFCWNYLLICSWSLEAMDRTSSLRRQLGWCMNK